VPVFAEQVASNDFQAPTTPLPIPARIQQKAFPVWKTSTAMSSPPNTSPFAARVRIGEDGFVAETLLDLWVRTGDATRAGSLLTVRDGRRYVLTNALRVLGRRNGDTDPYGFTGRVEAIRDFIRQGALAFADGIRLGSAVYDVEYGVIAIPLVSSPDESGANPAIR
jgi:hypothetical protein